MDTLNDYYPIYPQNPDNACLSDSDISENKEYCENLKNLNENRKRKRTLAFDDFCLIHTDDLWYLWCMIKEFTYNSNSILLSNLEFHSFCAMCYENSSKF